MVALDQVEDERREAAELVQQLAAPATGWPWITANSSSVSLPGLLRIASGHGELAHVVQQAAEGEQPQAGGSGSAAVRRSARRASRRGACGPRSSGPSRRGAASARGRGRRGTPPRRRRASAARRSPTSGREAVGVAQVQRRRDADQPDAGDLERVRDPPARGPSSRVQQAVLAPDQPDDADRHEQVRRAAREQERAPGAPGEQPSSGRRRRRRAAAPALP